MTNAIVVHKKDDVAVATKAISKGEDMTYSLGGKEIAIKAADDIPVYHKIAIKSVKKGNNVLKYGEIIGYATADIETGNHVHTHNLSDFVKRKDVEQI